jgi:ABC-2 type transport system ATP-binding protein
MTLILDSLHKRFGAIAALDGVSFSVGPGEVFGFLGANGAGKTTTMRIILGILRADEGTVTWDGQPSTKLPRRTWGYLPEERGLYPRMEVLEQLVFFATLYGVPRRVATERARHWLARFRVSEYEKRRAEELSKGNQQKVQVIAAILHDPPVLLLDEPFVGLDPVNVALLKDALVELRDQGKTLVFSTHQMEMVEELCESVALLDHGRVIVAGPVRDVRRSTGRRVVRIGVAGDPELPWLADLAGVKVTRPGMDFTELDVDAGRDPESILLEAQARGERIMRFEIGDPSIEQIFIERVGRPPSDEHRLAAAAPSVPPRAATAGTAGSGAAR